MRGPMSRPIQPSGTSTPSLSRALGAGVEALARAPGRPAAPARTGALSARSSASRRQLHALLLDQRVAGSDPLRPEEAEAHRAADQDPVGELQEAVDHADLVGDLGAAEDDDQRPRRATRPPRLSSLTSRSSSRPGVAGQQARHALGAGVGAVGDAEGVVDVEVGERGERFGQRRVVLRLAGLEADVLQQQHFAGPERRRPSSRPRRRSRAGAWLHLGAEQLGQPLAHRPHRERRVGLALRAARGGRPGPAPRRARAAARSSAAPP